MHTTLPATGPLPRPGNLLPALELPDESGTSHTLWEYKQRHPVLLFVAPGLESDVALGAWLERVGAVWPKLAAHDAVLVLVTRNPGTRARAAQAALGAACRLLLDRDGSAARRWLAVEGSDWGLYLADRYLECLDLWAGGDASILPAPETVISTLAHAEQSDCACGLPAWPEE